MRAEVAAALSLAPNSAGSRLVHPFHCTKNSSFRRMYETTAPRPCCSCRIADKPAGTRFRFGAQFKARDRLRSRGRSPGGAESKAGLQCRSHVLPQGLVLGLGAI